MPYTILVEHAVGVVHPSPLRCLMVYGTVFLCVFVIEFVCIGHLLPAGKAADVANGAWIAVECYVEELILTNLVRYEVVYLVHRQLAIQCFYQLIVLDDTDMCILLALLHG